MMIPEKNRREISKYLFQSLSFSHTHFLSMHIHTHALICLVFTFIYCSGYLIRCLNLLLTNFRKSYRGSLLCQKRLQFGETSPNRCAESSGDKADAGLQIQGIRARDLRFDALLLHLTNDGIEFLRTYLNLPSEIVPATLKKSLKPLGARMGGPPGDRAR
ncbi:uncharacterized protein LOC132285426 isoform X2 [Cornus florida]|uniref:uncharacterized protein LOC132285426 isoform X2 n=1 Tax=Cornus florida TaxID=4283 RepID=UPI00289E2D95|nr:uncharacterized protein LOC132285426 isoform X2 [Cornus florida]